MRKYSQMFSGVHGPLTNTCLSLVKNSKAEQTRPRLSAGLPLCGVVFTLLLQVPFHVSVISKPPFPWVCFRKTFFHGFALARHPFTCMPQQTII